MARTALLQTKSHTQAGRTLVQFARRAQAQLRCPNRLTIVEGATHLFEEPGTLAEAVMHSRDWFVDHLPSTGIEHRSAAVRARPRDHTGPSTVEGTATAV